MRTAMAIAARWPAVNVKGGFSLPAERLSVAHQDLAPAVILDPLHAGDAAVQGPRRAAGHDISGIGPPMVTRQ